MQNLTITHPDSGKEVQLTISVEEHEHQQAWRVQFDDGKNVLLGIDQHRIWKQFHGDELDSNLISEIGKAIDNQEH